MMLLEDVHDDAIVVANLVFVPLILMTMVLLIVMMVIMVMMMLFLELLNFE